MLAHILAEFPEKIKNIRQPVGKFVHVLLLDEPTAFLHPQVLSPFYHLISKMASSVFNYQVILATHSDSLLRLLDPCSVISCESGEPKKLSNYLDVYELSKDIGVVGASMLSAYHTIVIVEGTGDRDFIKNLMYKHSPLAGYIDRSFV
jgi:ABC-type sulfate/molybdate transport systems ATPase subunit